MQTNLAYCREVAPGVVLGVTNDDQVGRKCIFSGDVVAVGDLSAEDEADAVAALERGISGPPLTRRQNTAGTARELLGHGQLKSTEVRFASDASITVKRRVRPISHGSFWRPAML